MTPVRSSLIVLLAAALAGCAGEATHFYTLLRPQNEPPRDAGAALAIDVQPVRIPAQLDQPELVVRQGEGEVALIETRRWIAPLGEEVRGAVIARLKRRLAAREVSQLAPPAGVPVYRVLLDVQRLDARLAKDVSVEAAWTVLEVSGEASAPRQRWTCASAASVPVTAGYEPLVLGIQQALERVGDDIAALIAEAAARGSVSCPVSARA